MWDSMRRGEGRLAALATSRRVRNVSVAYRPAFQFSKEGHYGRASSAVARGGD